jgi:hypothetical protein
MMGELQTSRVIHTDNRSNPSSSLDLLYVKGPV